MKSALILLLSCATFSLAQDMKIAPDKIKPEPPAQSEGAQKTDGAKPDAADAGATQVKRLASVTWDLNTHKLSWIVEKGSMVDGAFVPSSQGKYEVSPSEGFMAVNEEKRGIEDDEANALHELLGVLSVYCVESTVWWERGADDGTSPTLSPDAKPAAPGTKIEQRKGVDQDKPQPADKPGMKLIPGARVADPNLE